MRIDRYFVSFRQRARKRGVLIGRDKNNRDKEKDRERKKDRER